MTASPGVLATGTDISVRVLDTSRDVSDKHLTRLVLIGDRLTRIELNGNTSVQIASLFVDGTGWVEMVRDRWSHYKHGPGFQMGPKGSSGLCADADALTERLAAVFAACDSLATTEPAPLTQELAPSGWIIAASVDKTRFGYTWVGDVYQSRDAAAAGLHAARSEGRSGLQVYALYPCPDQIGEDR